MRRIIVWIFLSFLCGVVSYNISKWILIGAVLSALFLIIFIKSRRNILFYFLIFFLLGSGASRLHINIFRERYAMLQNLSQYEGFITDKEDNTYTVVNYKNGYKIVLSSYDKKEFFPGDYIVFSGTVREKPKYKEKIMNSMGIDAYISSYEGEMVKKDKSSLLMIPAKFKYKIVTTLSSIDAEGGAFINGLICGYSDGIASEDRIDFDEVGLSHVLAVSGFNLGIIYYFINIVTKKFSRKLRYCISVLICLLYVFITGFEPSITRAFIMLSVAAFASFMQKASDILASIAITAFIMLLFNTFYIFNIGFLLSFAATCGIILFKDEIRDKIKGKFEKAGEEIGVAGGAFAATFPIVLWYRGYVSLITIIINVLIAPLVSLLTVCGFTAAFVYLITGIKLLFYPVVFMGVMFMKVVKTVSDINLLVYPGKPSAFFIGLYYFSLMFYFGYIGLKLKGKYKRYIKLLLVGSLILLMFYHSPVLKIHMINVGQGDSIFIETPRRHTILIDTGPQIQEYTAAETKVIPFIKRQGYGKIDMLIITHFHSDHAGGIDYIKKNFEVGRVIAFGKPENVDMDLTQVSRGDSISTDGVYLKVLYPEKVNEAVDDKNENCIVLKLEYKGYSMLLTSDAEKGVMDSLAGDYDIIKIPHHGSYLSYSSEMIEKSSIGAALISVGKNSFGHPSVKVIDQLEERGIKVYRTDKVGDITIISSGESYRILSQSQ